MLKDRVDLMTRKYKCTKKKSASIMTGKVLKHISILQKRVVVGINPAPISGADAVKPSSPVLGIGGVTPVDGPAPSILGSLDNIFQSVKEYDTYHCLERML